MPQVPYDLGSPIVDCRICHFISFACGFIFTLIELPTNEIIVKEIEGLD